MSTNTAQLANASNLGQFMGGGPNHFSNNFLYRGIHYTEGVVYLRENGGHWLWSDIMIKLKSDPKCKNACSVKYTPAKGNKLASVSYYGVNDQTGDNVFLDRQEYSAACFTFPITFFIGEALDNDSKIVPVLMLSNEY